MRSLDRALAEDPDYVALGPIYETTLKAMPWAPQGLARIGEWKALAKRPLVAIGGITLERAPLVYDAGADSIAVVSDVVFNPDPERAVAGVARPEPPLLSKHSRFRQRIAPVFLGPFRRTGEMRNCGAEPEGQVSSRSRARHAG